MAMSMKLLFRPYINMAYTTTTITPVKIIHEISYYHSPKLPSFSGFSPPCISLLQCKTNRMLSSSINTTTTTTIGASSSSHNVNEAGSIDSSLMLSMQSKIKDELNAESVDVKDAYGDGRHVSIDVVSSAFEGQSAVNRQRMVYKAIWEELQTTVHAVDQMITRTPSEAAGDK